MKIRECHLIFIETGWQEESKVIPPKIWDDFHKARSRVVRTWGEPSDAKLKNNALSFFLTRTAKPTMGPRAPKLITGTRLGAGTIRASREKLSRIRSGIHKFECGLVDVDETEKYIKGLIGQLRFIHQLCPRDASKYAAQLRTPTAGRFLSSPDKKFLTAID